MDSVEKYLANYSGDSVASIAFAWNGKHAAEFVDSNLEFRRAVIQYVLTQLPETPLIIIKDLFRAEAAFAKEAWGVNRDLHMLGQELLTRGRTLYFQDFLLGATSSFDTLLECGNISIEPSLKKELADYCKSQIAEATNGSSSMWEYGLEKFSYVPPEKLSRKNWLLRLFGRN